MDLTFRMGERRDFAACLELLSEYRFSYSEEAWAYLPQMWRQLLANQSLKMLVIEDRGSHSTKSCVVGFVTLCFISDGFIREAETGLLPYFSPQIVRRVMQGASPILDVAAVRRGNSGDGLNIALLQGGWATGAFDADGFRHVRDRMVEAFYHFFAGYQLKAVYMELIGTKFLPWLLSGGMKVRTDYKDYYRAGAAAPMPEHHPYLMAVTREDAMSADGSRAAPLFLSTPPRFFFSPAEQALLERALLSETDEELAKSLNVSVWTVKKRWNSVYERVTAVAPDVLHVPSDQASLSEKFTEQKRGAEKRRHLLNYLRRHPEEMRPVKREKELH